MPKLKPTCLRKTKNSWSPWSQSGEWKGRKTMEEKNYGTMVTIRTTTVGVNNLQAYIDVN